MGIGIGLGIKLDNYKSGEAFAEPATPIALTTVYTAGTPSAATLADGYVAPVARNGTTSTVTITGTAESDYPMTFYLENDSGTTKCSFSVPAATGGAFSHSVDVPLTGGDFCVTKMSYTGSGVRYTDTRKWAVGFRFLVVGQSQLRILAGTDASEYTMDAANYGQISVIDGQAYNGNTTAVPLSLDIIDAADDSSDGVRAIADQWATVSSEVAQFVFEAVTGTGPKQFQQDALDQRRFSDLENKLVYGDTFTGTISVWGTNVFTDFSTAGDEFIEYLYGIDFNGVTADDSLADLTSYGEIGIMPPTRNSANTNEVTVTANAIDRVLESDIDGFVGLALADYEIEDAGGPHQRTDSEGNAIIGARIAMLASEMAGEGDFAKPYWVSVERNEAGTTLSVTPNLPNGGSMSSPSPTAIQGLEVYHDGGWVGSSEFATSISGGKLVLTKNSGTWDFVHDLQWRRIPQFALNSGPLDRATETAIVAGEVYETDADDVNGNGWPIHGIMGDDGIRFQGSLVPTQENLGSIGETADVTFLKSSNEAAASTSQKKIDNAWVASTGLPSDGDVFVTCVAMKSHVSGGGTITDHYAIDPGVDSTVLGVSTITVTTNAGGVISGVYMNDYTVDTGVKPAFPDFWASCTSNNSTTLQATVKLDGCTLTGATYKTSRTGALTFTGVAANTSFIITAQNSAGTTLTPAAGLTEVASHTAAGSKQAVYTAKTLAGGIIEIRIPEATEIAVRALPST